MSYFLNNLKIKCCKSARPGRFGQIGPFWAGRFGSGRFGPGTIWVGPDRAETDLGRAGSGRDRFGSGRFGPEPILADTNKPDRPFFGNFLKLI